MKTAIIGLGMTGRSCLRFLKDKQVTAFDTRLNLPQLEKLQKSYPNVKFKLGELKFETLSQFEEIIVSPGFDLQNKIIKQCENQGISVIGDIELFSRHAKAPVVGITGTNGKSTVTQLFANIAMACGLKVAVGGNLGKPALDLLSENTDLFVLELSSYQLARTHTLKLEVATILNVTPDHLEQHGDFENYLQAKQKIYGFSDLCVFNRQDSKTFTKVSSISFGLDSPKDSQFGIMHEQGKIYLAYGAEKLVDVRDLKLKGQHNWLNTLAALALGKAIGLQLQAMLDAAKDFQGLEHRCEYVNKINGVDWYNDSKATNASSATAAFNSLGIEYAQQLIWIAGGQAKSKEDLNNLAKSVQKNVKYVILFGQDKELIKSAIQPYTNYQCVESLNEAVNLAKEKSRSDDCVLFSPACASFDMFDNFSDRGDKFKMLVKNI